MQRQSDHCIGILDHMSSSPTLICRNNEVNEAHIKESSFKRKKEDNITKRDAQLDGSGCKSCILSDFYRVPSLFQKSTGNLIC